MEQTSKSGRQTSKNPIAVVIVMGANTGLGKSVLSDAVTAYFEAAGVSVTSVRIETAVRRREFGTSTELVAAAKE